MITKLKDKIEGSGEVSGFIFTKEFENDKGYVFKSSSDGFYHYEAFLRKSVPICIDFKNRVYSEVDFRELYPKAKDFGVWAWTVKILERGIEKLNS